MKRAGAIAASSFAFAALLGLGAGCGYHPVYGGETPGGRLHVVPAALTVSEPEAVQAVLAGARSELAQAGVLGTSGYPRLVVEVVRIDETGAGIAARGDATPLARGSTVAVVARAWVEERAGEAPSRETGDMRRSELIATSLDAPSDALRHREGLRSAGRELGRALARRILGDPTPGDSD